MKKLRLLVTDKCNRNCEMCCNKNYNLEALPRFNPIDIGEYDEIILTGGEPLLLKENLLKYIEILKNINCNIPIYLYTTTIILNNIDNIFLKY